MDGALYNVNRSDCESSDSELSDSDAPEPPPRFESLNTFPNDLVDEESSVSESESDDENGPTPPPLPPPRNTDLSESNEYVIVYMLNITYIYHNFYLFLF